MSRRAGNLATTALAAIVLAGGLWIGARPVASAPALGPFLDPIHGVWGVATTAELPTETKAAIPSLEGDVTVKYDDRGVAHIFATSEGDVARAMGWVTARDRLFQMELQTRAVAGTLSEIAGARTVPLDRRARQQGLAWGATRKCEALKQDAPAHLAINAFAEGVNAYIDQMSRADTPLEFRLLGAKPQRWEPKYTCYLLAQLGLTLAFTDGELRRTQVEAMVGRAATDRLFAAHAPIQEPIQPVAGRTAPRTAFAPLPVPQPTDSAKLAFANALAERWTYAAAARGDLSVARRQPNLWPTVAASVRLRMEPAIVDRFFFRPA
ncbi:MAG: penicillin acylase family protein, partial [Gemmatimonadaceae bacterium]|nr:penicillin acylase family protein [Gemmatimonadaceae bacterium]